VKINAINALAALALGAGLAACGSSPHHASGPPKPSALASRIECRVTGPDSAPQTAYDTLQYVDVAEGPCSGAYGPISIITFASMAKETDWLHQNAGMENQEFGGGYFEVITGHLWVLASAGSLGRGEAYMARRLGGKDNVF
jgi:hypothetical protein